MDTNELQARAAERLDAERNARLEAITAFGAAAQSAAEAKELAAAAEREHTAAYAKAQRLGWSDADFKELGIAIPEKKPQGRPRGQKKAAAS